MTEIEEKSLKTQLKLSEEIHNADRMIIHLVRSSGRQLLQTISQKSYLKEGQTTVELTVEEFTNIRVFLARLSEQSPNSEFGRINDDMVSTYLQEKETKMNILRMLS